MKWFFYWISLVTNYIVRFIEDDKCILIINFVMVWNSLNGINLIRVIEFF